MYYKKLFITLFAVCLLTGQAFAQHSVENAKASDDSASLVISSEGDKLYTKSMSVKSAVNDYIGVMYKQSPATADSVIEVEQSYERPSTGEGVADADFIVTEALATPANGNWHIATIDTVAMPYLRFKLTGTTTNATSTIKVFKP